MWCSSWHSRCSGSLRFIGCSNGATSTGRIGIGDSSGLDRGGLEPMIGWRKPKTAFALSGGGARGAMQVGILRALLEREIYPDFIVGVSAGAWNGIWLASRPQASEITGLEQ